MAVVQVGADDDTSRGVALEAPAQDEPDEFIVMAGSACQACYLFRPQASSEVGEGFKEPAMIAADTVGSPLLPAG